MDTSCTVETSHTVDTSRNAETSEPMETQHTVEQRLDTKPGVRLVVAAFLGIAAGILISFGSVAASFLGGWAVAGMVYVLWTLAVVMPMGPQATAEHATREEPGRAATRILVLVAALVSLAGLVVVLAQGGLRVNALTDVAVLSAVVASWACIQTVFALHYARQYYTSPVGGIDFHADKQPAGEPELPQYTDFTYVAFTVGMSYAISDTDLASSQMRRLAQAHALLAYLYGTVIVALLINLIAGLAG